MPEKKSDAKQRRGPTVPEADLPEVEIFFDARDSSYWYKLNGHFCAFKKSDLKMILQTLGYSDFPSQKVPGLSIIDVPFHDAMQRRMVHFTGPLSGHRTGLFRDYSGNNCLITAEANPRVFDKTPKKFPKPWRLINFMSELLPGDQLDYMTWWMKVGRVSQLLGDFRPGQAVVLAGKAGCGKSLMQNIVTEFFGGRVADPFRYMTGVTVFNRDICSAEHWQMSDPPTTTDMRTRLKFGDYLKDATVNRDFSVHGKGKDALCLMPVFHRITISVNDEPECLAVVPPMIDSIADKIFLFQCERASVGSDRAEIWSWVKEEIPLLWAHIDSLNLKDIPAELRDDRFGIRAWHHPKLLEELSALSAEIRLLQIYDQVFYSGNPATWESPTRRRAIEIEQVLRRSEYGFACEKLLSYSGACGSHLGKLAKSMPERVQKHVLDGTSFWTIQPPSEVQQKLAA